MRRTILALSLAGLLGACETTNSDDWAGGATTPFNQAERSCGALLEDMERDDRRRDFFIGCMASLGWTPRPGAAIAL